jgi:hypothetical protein
MDIELYGARALPVCQQRPFSCYRLWQRHLLWFGRFGGGLVLRFVEKLLTERCAGAVVTLHSSKRTIALLPKPIRLPDFHHDGFACMLQAVVVEECKRAINKGKVFLSFKKAVEGNAWPRLIKPKVKHHWLVMTSSNEIKSCTELVRSRINPRNFLLVTANGESQNQVNHISVTFLEWCSTGPRPGWLTRLTRVSVSVSIVFKAFSENARPL